MIFKSPRFDLFSANMAVFVSKSDNTVRQTDDRVARLARNCVKSDKCSPFYERMIGTFWYGEFGEQKCTVHLTLKNIILFNLILLVANLENRQRGKKRPVSIVGFLLRTEPAPFASGC